MSNKFFLVLIYLIIILLIPFFLDYLSEITIRKNRKNLINEKATKKSKTTNKPLVIFNGIFNGSVDGENFSGDIFEIINQMDNNSCVIYIVDTLEYVQNPSNLIKELNRVSGNDLFIVCIEKNSPRTFWDPKIINLMDKNYYLPLENITWNLPNNLQNKIRNIYAYLFGIIPYDKINSFIKKID